MFSEFQDIVDGTSPITGCLFFAGGPELLTTHTNGTANVILEGSSPGAPSCRFTSGATGVDLDNQDPEGIQICFDLLVQAAADAGVPCLGL